MIASTKMQDNKPAEIIVSGPTEGKQRHVILDALRGLALAGIVLANFPEFGLWTFLSTAQQEAMPSADIDKVTRFFQYFLVDGKFYTIFSLLFGIGFSLILARHNSALFLRRMAILLVIGFCHLMFIWSGDILMLYAAAGMLLPLFFRLSDRTQLWVAAALILLPVGLDALTEWGGVDFSGPFYNAWWATAGRYGINEDNFASWLRDAHSYPQMFAFLLQGACERMWEFVSGHRLPKVLGLFIIGSLIGKHALYAKLEKLPLKRACAAFFAIGVPMSLLYAWSATHGHVWGDTVHSLLYAVSVIPMALGYITAFCLLFKRYPGHSSFRLLAAPGRMALTNYISQSVVGVILFYGVGFGLGLKFGLLQIEMLALLLFALQIAFSCLWLRYFRFGPLEWIWRMLTYGKIFSIKKVDE